MTPLPPLIPSHTLHRIIGTGAYGDVWLASDSMGAWRAIKVVRRDRFASDRPYEREFSGIEKFTPVSRAHPSQVDVFAAVRNERDGWFYYVMELADDTQSGQQIDPDRYMPRTLASDLSEKKRLPAEVCLAVGVALATALEHLHAHGLVHRDIKPANIIFVHGQPKLADIGLVAEIEDARSFVGTDGYVPPEGPGTMRADLFSLGRVLYQMHTGLPQSQFPDLPTHLGSAEDTALAREFNLIILRACAPEAGKRHTNPTELREELVLLQSGRSIQRLRNAEKRAATFVKAGIFAGVVAVLALVAFLASLKSKREADTARINAEQAQRSESEMRIELERNLADARLFQIRDKRRHPVPGYKAAGLAMISSVAKNRQSKELADEAIAYLALWDLVPGGEWQMPEGTLDSDITLSHDRYATIGAQGRVTLWEPGNGKPLWQTDALPGLNHLRFTNDGRFLLATNAKEWILLDAKTGARPWTPTLGAALLGPVIGGRWLGLWEEGALVMRETATGTEVRRAPASVTVGLTAPPLVVFDETRAQFCIRRGEKLEVWRWDTWISTASGRLDEEPTVIAVRGDFMAVGDASGRVRVRDNQRAKWNELPAHSARVDDVWFTPDGEILVTHAEDGTACFWVEDRLILTARDTHPRAADPSMRTITFSDAHHAGWLHADVPGNLKSISWPEADWDCRDINISPGGSLVSASYRNGFGVAVVATGEKLAFQPVEKHRQTWFLDSSILLTLSDETISTRSCEVVGSGNGNWLRMNRRRSRARMGDATNYDAGVLSQDRRKLAVSDQSHRTLLYNLREPQKALSDPMPRPITGDFSPDGKLAVFAYGDNSRTNVMDVEGGKFNFSRTLNFDNCSVAFSPDNQFLVLGGGRLYRFYDRSTWRVISQIATEATDWEWNPCAFSADGRFLAIVLENRRVALLDGSTREPLAILDAPNPERIRRLTWSPDGHFLAVGSERRTDMWNVSGMSGELTALALESPLRNRVAAPAKSNPTFVDVIAELMPTLRLGPSTKLTVPPRAPAASPQQIDLTEFYDATFNSAWHGKDDGNYLTLPSGLQTLDGITWDARGILQLASPTLLSNSGIPPLKVRGIPVAQNCKHLHFLGANCLGGGVEGETTATFTVHYRDGSTWEFPVRFGIECADWWAEPNAVSASPGKVAWSGENRFSESRDDLSIRLFHYQWENPMPDLRVESLEFASSLKTAAPFVVAITAE